MKKANIATAKNEFSRLLRRVKRGESVLITERNRPVARLEPIGISGSDPLAPLYESGTLCPPARSQWDVASFLAALPPSPALPPERSLTAAVLAERAESP